MEIALKSEVGGTASVPSATLNLLALLAHTSCVEIEVAALGLRLCYSERGEICGQQ
jgi:hypothetical protein